MKFSIITVNFNNPEGLERTINSVLGQSFRDFEYIIVDGASTKGDVEIIKKYSDRISCWVSEKDSGIYNAMNKGVRMANGEYCLFMNSGDELYDSDLLANVALAGPVSDFVQGIICRPGRKDAFFYPPKVEDLSLGWYVWGSNNFHQASFIKRTMLLEHPYDESLKVAADLKFNVECIVKYKCSYESLDIVIAKYEYGGVSHTNNHSEETRMLFQDLFGERVMLDYYSLAYVKRFPVNRIMPVLKALGESRIWRKIRKNNNR